MELDAVVRHASMVPHRKQTTERSVVRLRSDCRARWAKRRIRRSTLSSSPRCLKKYLGHSCVAALDRSSVRTPIHGY